MARTPGPWHPFRFLRDTNGIALHGVGVMADVDGREVIICEAYPAPSPVAVNEENMRLIAEAPAMAEVLREVGRCPMAMVAIAHMDVTLGEKLYAILAAIDGEN